MPKSPDCVGSSGDIAMGNTDVVVAAEFGADRRV